MSLQTTGPLAMVGADIAERHRLDGLDLRGMRDAPVVREYFGRSDEVRLGPQAFLVETYPPNSTTRAHFHSVDQFQIFFPAAGAWYQRHSISSTTLHYADAYRTYGPFGSAQEPMAFFTLRPTANAVTGFMPEDRAKLVRRGRRNLEVDLAEAMSRTPAPGKAVVETLIDPHEDGLAAYLVVAGRSGQAPWPSTVGEGGGTYVCVVRGTVVYRGEAYGERSLGWADAGAPQAALASENDEGFAVLVMQFPTRSDPRSEDIIS